MEEIITALLSGVAGGRRYWVRAPQDAGKPYVVLYRIDGVPGYHYQGRDLTSSRIQANCYGATFTSAKQTADAVIAALEGRSSGPIRGIFVESDYRDLATEDAGGVTPLFAVAVDLNVIHT